MIKIEIFYGIIIGVLIYSAICTVVAWFFTGENIYDVVSIGVVGWCFVFILWLITKKRYWNDYHDKRSIILIEETGEMKWCHLKDTNDIYYWNDGYRLIKRCAPKNEWKKLNTFDKNFINACKINCDRCKYDDECRNSQARCRTDNTGVVLGFDKFEKKNKWVKFWRKKL